MIKYIQRRIGYSVALFAFILSTISLVHFLVVRQYSLLQILQEPSVTAVFLTGILVLLTGIFRNSFTRIIQVLLFYITGLIPGFEAIPGNLTSAIFIGFSLMLLIEYGFLKKKYFLKLSLFVGFYIASIIYGFITRSTVPMSDFVHTALGILLALYLFYIMIEIRNMHHLRVNNELEDMVQERTKELHNKMREVEEYQQQLEATLQEKNKLIAEKNLLLQELHHRTKNNIQLIQSLLDLEKEKISDKNALTIVEKTRNRIRAISTLHEFMYQKDQLAIVSLNTYIGTLLSDLWQVYYNPNVHFDVSLGEDVWIKMEHATPIGIILNELFCNAITHAFDQEKNGDILVETFLYKDEVNLTFADNGSGMPKIEEINTESSLGIELIQTLVTQIDGTYEIKHVNGTRWILSFPIKALIAE
jgi:two-component sensor histidine kinase